ncbi:MAG: hypothetical protein GY798_23220 [Hyphomicrobiales bacterium]|nr:hypothetical protein [Hyphomicrobiales bacterium]
MTEFSSTGYWEDRYKSGGHSCSGSRVVLSKYKVGFLNKFFRNHKIDSVIDLEVGDGQVAQGLRVPGYLGVDLSRSTLDLVKKANEPSMHKRFMLSGDLEASGISSDVTMSIDVIFHLVEGDVDDCHMSTLFDRSTQWVIIHTSNFDRPGDPSHVRHRCFSAWIHANRKDWGLHQYNPNPHFSPPKAKLPDKTFAEFYTFRRIG